MAESLAQIRRSAHCKYRAHGFQRPLAVTVEVESGKDIRSDIAARIVGCGLGLYELRGVSLSLEEIFLQLTTEDAAQKPAA